MRILRRLTGAFFLTAMIGIAVIAFKPSAASATGSWVWPLGHERIDHDFDPPSSPYAAGHRGVDLPGRVGMPVRAVAAGQVAFAGKVAGIPVVTVIHGQEKSTYQPVIARVKKGDAVKAGDAIGQLSGAGSHCAAACLHLGRVVDGIYLDPTELLRSRSQVVLISPHGPPPRPPADMLAAGLGQPVAGPVTSPFGMRTHPITGERKLHDGTDFGAPCGTPVYAAAGGTVIQRTEHPAYGKRIILRHAADLETSYNHLSVQSVSVGARVLAGEQIGAVGTTGLSTGCHLHFMVVKNGSPVAPK